MFNKIDHRGRVIFVDDEAPVWLLMRQDWERRHPIKAWLRRRFFNTR